MDTLVMLGIAAVVIVSITSHEAAHGFVADYFGDPTARARGRLTLNPIPHIDLMMTIVLPAVLLMSGAGVIFGGAKPVPVNVARLRNPKRDWALVGAAGPLTNLTLSIGLSLLLSVLVKVGLLTPLSQLTEVLAAGIFVNVLLFVFNLVPIPPLDGSRVVMAFLSGNALAAYQRFERFGLILIFSLVMFVPAARALLSAALREVTLMVTAPFGVGPIVVLGLRNLGA